MGNNDHNRVTRGKTNSTKASKCMDRPIRCFSLIPKCKEHTNSCLCWESNPSHSVTSEVHISSGAYCDKNKNKRNYFVHWNIFLLLPLSLIFH
jgi:hypothetical protein